jgi:hypothetical protein
LWSAFSYALVDLKKSAVNAGTEEGKEGGVEGGTEFTRVLLISFLDEGSDAHISVAIQEGLVVNMKVYGGGI